MLITEGTLRKITFHPAWDSLNGGEKEQEKSYYQMLPWFVGLGFSMVNSEHSTFKYFVSKGPGIQPIMSQFIEPIIARSYSSYL